MDTGIWQITLPQQQPVMPDTTFIQVATMLGVIAILIFQILQVRTSGKCWAGQVPLGFAVTHFLVYYICHYLDAFNIINFHAIHPFIFTIWSSWRSAHLIGTIVGIEYFRLRRMMLEKRYGR